MAIRVLHCFKTAATGVGAITAAVAAAVVIGPSVYPDGVQYHVSFASERGLAAAEDDIAGCADRLGVSADRWHLLAGPPHVLVNRSFWSRSAPAERCLESIPGARVKDLHGSESILFE